MFEFLQTSSLDGIWYWDLEDPEHEWLSPRFWEILGYDPTTMPHLVSAWQALIHPDDLEQVMAGIEMHSAVPSHPYDQVARYQHKDGSQAWIRRRGILICDEAGCPVRILGAHTDITKLKQTEIGLMERTQELEAANAKLLKTLNGILSICSSCKKIRNEDGRWDEIETFITRNSSAEFSHGLCRDCFSNSYPDLEYDDSLD